MVSSLSWIRVVISFDSAQEWSESATRTGTTLCYHKDSTLITSLEVVMIESAKSGEFKLGRLAGLDISATSSAIIGALVLWIILSAFAYFVLKRSLGTATIGGLAAVILHEFGELWHQLGHSWAARSTGHPMTGIRFGFLGVLSTALYPADEEKLSPGIHIRRALGGPLASLVLSAIALIIFLAVANGRSGGTLWWLALFFFLENFLVYTLEVFVPLGFNDASTILHWLRQPAAK
jgi:hypothetical protein